MKVIDDSEAERVVVENAKNATCELERIYYSHTGRRIFKWHHYLGIYDRHLGRYRDAPLDRGAKLTVPAGTIRVLELGVQNGGSLQMWREYFGENAIIFGVDIDPRCKGFEDMGCQIRIGSQDDPAFLSSVVEEMGGVDIVIDDGSHIASHQVASFKALFPRISQGGLYIVEDLHTAYWNDWEGGLRRAGTFIEIVKDVIDHMHEWYVGVDTGLSPLDIKTSVTGMHIYDSIVVIEKGAKSEPYAVHVGVSSFDPIDEGRVEVEGVVGASAVQPSLEARGSVHVQADPVRVSGTLRRRIGRKLSPGVRQRILKALHALGIRT